MRDEINEDILKPAKKRVKKNDDEAEKVNQLMYQPDFTLMLRLKEINEQMGTMTIEQRPLEIEPKVPKEKENVQIAVNLDEKFNQELEEEEIKKVFRQLSAFETNPSLIVS